MLSSWHSSGEQNLAVRSRYRKKTLYSSQLPIGVNTSYIPVKKNFLYSRGRENSRNFNWLEPSNNKNLNILDKPGCPDRNNFGLIFSIQMLKRFLTFVTRRIIHKVLLFTSDRLICTQKPS